MVVSPVFWTRLSIIFTTAPTTSRKVVGRNIVIPTDTGAVDQQVGVPGGKYNRLPLVSSVGHKIDVSLLIRQHFHEIAQTGFRVSKRAATSAVAVHGTEVAVSVHQRVTGRPLLYGPC